MWAIRVSAKAPLFSGRALILGSGGAGGSPRHSIPTMLLFGSVSFPPFPLLLASLPAHSSTCQSPPLASLSAPPTHPTSNSPSILPFLSPSVCPFLTNLPGSVAPWLSPSLPPCLPPFTRSLALRWQGRAFRSPEARTHPRRRVSALQMCLE